MVINTNIAAQAAANGLAESSRLLSKSLARLSSGSKIVSPDDDAAGLAVSLRFDAQINRTSASVANLGNAISFSQTQDGFLQKIGNALDRMSELAIRAQDVTKTDSDRSLYNQEFQTLAAYVNNAATRDFNGVSLFSGNALSVTTDSEGGTFQMQGISANYIAGAATPSLPGPPATSVTLGQLIPGFSGGSLRFGPSSAPTSTTSFNSSNTLGDVVNWLNSAFGTYSPSGGSASYNSSTGQLSVTVNSGYGVDGFPGSLLTDLGLPSDFYNFSGPSSLSGSSTLSYTPPQPVSTAPDVSTANSAASALTTIKSAINQLASDRASVGANLARLSYSSDQLGTLKDNLTAANSRIKDVDVAEESTAYARYNILVQAGTSMLAQANSGPQSMLRLLS